MPRQRVTIERIARETGLSKFSVSRALSGKSGVGEETRARVVRAATRLGYRVAATGTRRVLFVMQDQDPFGSELTINMLHGAEREAARRGLTITSRLAPQFAASASLEPDIVGVLLALNRPEQLLQHALRLGPPVVCGGYGDPLTRVDRVVGDDWAGGIAIGRHLASLGHRTIGFVRGEAGLSGRGERLRGLRDGMADAGPCMLRELGFAEPDGFRAAFLATLASGFLPSALFCAHDGMAITVISELLRLGIKVPEDVSVAGFNDFACATQLAPQLTTMRMPQEAAGELMVRCLAMRLADAKAVLPPLRIALALDLVVRASTAPAAPPRYAARLTRQRARQAALV